MPPYTCIFDRKNHEIHCRCSQDGHSLAPTNRVRGFGTAGRIGGTREGQGKAAAVALALGWWKREMHAWGSGAAGDHIQGLRAQANIRGQCASSSAHWSLASFHLSFQPSAPFFAQTSICCCSLLSAAASSPLLTHPAFLVGA